MASNDNRSLGEVVKSAYLSIDRRTLGLTRLALGALLLGDLARRTPDWLAMYSSTGVLPSQLILARPQSDGFTLFSSFGTPGELWTLWAVGLAAYLCLFFGYRTKAAQIVSLVFVTSMNGRVLLIENGGYVVQNLLLLWTLFLPLGDRFSVDALLASLKKRRERSAADLDDRTPIDPRLRTPHVSLAALAIVLQLSAVYFFNVVHKTGPAWSNGTAVHYVLHNDRMVTPFFAHTRYYLPAFVIQILSRGTLAIEAGLVLLLLTPIARTWARRGVFFGMSALHTGFGSTFTLGPFAWSCCTFSTLFIGREDWELAKKTMRRPHRAITIELDASSVSALFACRLLRRFDGLGLIRFRETSKEHAGERLAVLDSSGERSSRARALEKIINALPLGPLIAWKLRIPFVRAAYDRILDWIGRLPLDRWFGSNAPPSVPPPPRAFAGAREAITAGLREALVALMMLAAVNQALVELWVARPLHASQPEPMRTLTHKMRFLQGWFMFSPNPVMDDGTIVVDAITASGRHVDPFTGQEPNFDLAGARSLRLSQIWGDYLNRMHLPGNSGYRDAMKAYMLRLPERTKDAGDAIVSGKVYWIQDLSPVIGETEPTKFEKLELFAFNGETIARSVQ